MELPAVIGNRRNRLILVANLCDMKMAALKGGHSHLDIDIIGLFYRIYTLQLLFARPNWDPASLAGNDD
jgi:hypothetical protein